MITSDKFKGCISPRALRQSELVVPCGQCANCLKSRVDQWSTRLYYEEKVSTLPIFLTLTYSSDYVPISPNGFMTLDKKELIRFLKRLRMQMHRHDIKQKGFKPRKLRYFACGEYGGQTNRPHYHLIIFNATHDEIETNWSSMETGEPLGAPYYGDVTSNSITYCAKYMQKPKKERLHARDDREEQFFIYSKGLGSSYLTPSKIAWHQAVPHERYYAHRNGYATSLPKSWKQKIFTQEMRQLANEHFQRLAQEKGNSMFVLPSELDAHLKNKQKRFTVL